MSLIVAIDARSIGQRHTGDTVYWTGLVKALMELDSEIEYLLISNTGRPEVIPDHPRFSWHEVTSRKARWWSLIRFPLYARRLGAQVIHTQYNMSPLVNKGGITTVHDVSFFHEPEWFQPRDRVLLQRFVPASARRASKVITVSDFSRQEIEKYISGVESKIVVAHNACSSSIQKKDPVDARARLASELGVEGPFVLTVGTRWPRKNMSLAIEAMEQISENLPHKIVVTGKPGWGEESVGTRTHLTGFVSDDQLCDLYSSADLYLAPALYEGFGITLLEAFRCGCPVVASPIPAHHEVAGNAAHIPSGFETTQWGSEISSLLSDGATTEKLRKLGMERESKFTWEASARIHEDTYRKVAADAVG